MAIRPFGLGDIRLLLGLQRSSAPLAIEHILTHPRAPLWIALTAPWPWAGAGVATYVLREERPEGRLVGFIQLVQRASRPEADLLHLGPALSMADPTVGDGADIWDSLLAHSASAAASHGLQRIFASIPDGGPEDGRLRGAGFSLYARETIYRLAVAPGLRDGISLGLVPATAPAGTRPQIPQDSWALQRVYTRCTPQLVQHSEGAAAGDVGSPPLSWWEPDRWTGVVWEPAGEVRGVVQVHLGRAGHWLRIWGANALTPRELRGLIAEGLRAIAVACEGARAAPVYVTVRDYEAGMAGTLVGFGFAPYTDRLRFVRHIGARARKAVPVALPTIEVRQALTETGKAPVRYGLRWRTEGLPFPEVEQKK
jgi:hypothetical protein